MHRVEALTRELVVDLDFVEVRLRHGVVCHAAIRHCLIVGIRSHVAIVDNHVEVLTIWEEQGVIKKLHLIVWKLGAVPREAWFVPVFFLERVVADIFKDLVALYGFVPLNAKATVSLSGQRVERDLDIVADVFLDLIFVIQRCGEHELLT
jgi:hypothetical protein